MCVKPGPPHKANKEVKRACYRDRAGAESFTYPKIQQRQETKITPLYIWPYQFIICVKYQGQAASCYSKTVIAQYICEYKCMGKHVKNTISCLRNINEKA